MEIVPVVKTIVKLLVVTAILHGIGSIAEVDLFFYAATSTGVLIALNTYWLVICLIAWFTERKNTEGLSNAPTTWLQNTSQTAHMLPDYVPAMDVTDFQGDDVSANRSNSAIRVRCNRLNRRKSPFG
jgi:hypothetical protein